MHGCIPKWLVRGLALAAACGGYQLGWAQEVQPQYVPETGFGLVAEAPQGVPEGQLVSGYTAADDVGARLDKIEQALKKIDDKSAADKKKAASKMSAEVGGMIQLDYDLFNQSALNRSASQFGDVQDGLAFRRARIWVSGKGFDIFDYKIEADFAGYTASTTTGGAYTDNPGIKDCFCGVSDLPVLGHVRIGHFKEPFGLDQLTSDRFTTFMERSMPDEGSVVPARNTGIMAFDTYANDHGTWALGVFRSFMTDTPPIRQNDNGGAAVTGRVTYLPWYDEATEGRGLLHLGAAYSYRDMDTQGPLTFSARPETYLAPSVVSLSFAAGDVQDWQLAGGEAALVYGPFSMQSEYFGAWIHRSNGQTGNINGCYAYVSYFLTGESRNYNRKNGYFDRVRPFENFFRVRAEDNCVYTGKGAWELAYRWSYLDEEDYAALGQHGGRAMDQTLGVNWYMTPYVRMMWNYVHSQDNPYQKANGSQSWMDTYEMRLSLDF